MDNNVRRACFSQANIKVLMFGARRVGKSSIVASMLSDRFRSAAVRDTDLILDFNAEGQEGTYEKIKEIEKMMIKYFDPATPIPRNSSDQGPIEVAERDCFSVFKLDGGASMEEVDVSVTLRTKNRNGVYKIQFIDIPGEWINNYNGDIPDGDRQHLQGLVAEADVILITVDSVLLMEDAGANALTANRIENVTNIIKENYNRICDNPKKLILFVPAKCERYYNKHMDIIEHPENAYDVEEDPMDRLKAQIRRFYGPLITWLREGENGTNATNFDVAILPVLTLGNIQFSHIDYGSGKTSGNFDNSDMYYRYKKRVTGDSVGYEDEYAVPEYAPAYCEQPLVMILLYQLEKIRRLKENRTIWQRLGATFLRIFGGLATDDELLENIPTLRKNLAVNQKGYVSAFLQDPITNANTRIVQE